ncbi:hypothetical protein TSAR_004171, partial [Trichomalopsis sarcophagae]
QSNTNIVNSEKPEQKRNKDCILKLTRLEEEPRRKRAKVENQFFLVNNQPNIHTSGNSHWLQKHGDRRRKDEEKRKGQNQKKQKEEALKIKKARVLLVRSEAKTSQDSTISRTPLLTSCTECREDCWYSGDALHDLPWLLCIVCQTNWANEQSNTNIVNSEKPEQKRNKDCILKLTRLEEEPRRKRAKVENRFILRSIKICIKKKPNDKKKKSVKNTETEEEKTKRRERDRIRKREQRKKQKKEALKIKKARVLLVRSEAKTSQHSTISRTPLFTLHDFPWLLCVVCQTNWANGKCVQRIPYECRTCRIRRSSLSN